MKKLKFRSEIEFSAAGTFTIKDTKLRLEQSGIAFDVKNVKGYEILQKQYSEILGTETLDFAAIFDNNNTVENITPKDSDFLKVPFRLLSAGIVGAGTWKATDFSNEKVLKASYKKLINKPVYTDHSTYTVNNAVGKVFEASWQEGYVSDNKEKIPAGINAILGIDVKTAPKLARDILSDIVHSNSVTVTFDWEPSHDGFESEYSFLDQIGQVIEGKMVTRVVTEIHNYYETSMVWLGSDPFAKKMDENGQLVNVDTASIYADETDEIKRYYSKNKSYGVSCFSKENSLLTPFQKEREFFNTFAKTQNDKDMEKKLQEALLVKLGLSKETPLTVEHINNIVIAPQESFSKLKTLEALEQIAKDELKLTVVNMDEISKTHTFIKKGELATKLVAVETERNIFQKEAQDGKVEIVSLSAKVTELKGSNAALTAENTKLTGTIENNKTTLAAGESFVKTKRDEVVRLYKVAVKNETDESVLSIMGKATNEELDGLLKQYSITATSRFTAKCKKCGAEDFSFRSSLIPDTGDPKEKGIEKLDFAALQEQFRESGLQK